MFITVGAEKAGAREAMRYGHFFSGILGFSLGLFFTYMNSPLVVEFIKGALQPVTVILGLLVLLSVVFNKTKHKKINLAAAVVLLALGAYGVYDEYLAVKDLFFGAGPILLICLGCLAVANGIKAMS